MGDSLVPSGVVEGLQGFLLQVEISEIIVHEADEPNALVDFLDAEFLACRGAGSASPNADMSAPLAHAQNAPVPPKRVRSSLKLDDRLFATKVREGASRRNHFTEVTKLS
jgi:hypothetical protein